MADKRGQARVMACVFLREWGSLTAMNMPSFSPPGTPLVRRWTFWAALIVVLLGPPSVLPAIDLTVTSWFYDAGSHGFPVRAVAWAEWVRRQWQFTVVIPAVVLVPVLWAVSEIRHKPILGVERRIALFLLASLALGPGLIVNLALKDHWGRPRPSTITEFGGAYEYRLPLSPGGPCGKNCSFPSGHASLAFWLAAPASLAPRRWRKAAVALAITAGLAVGAIRIAQGGHFFSDVLYAGVLVLGATAFLRHRILGCRFNDLSKAVDPSSKYNP